MPKSYLLQEDGFKITLGDGTGFLLLEESFGDPGGVVGTDEAQVHVVGPIVPQGTVARDDAATSSVVGSDMVTTRVVGSDEPGVVVVDG